MGYNGFGMRKEVYTRKPKKVFGHVKKIYGEELKKRSHSGTVDKTELSEKQKQAILIKIKRSLWLTNVKTIAVFVVIILLVIGGILWNKHYYLNGNEKFSTVTYSENLVVTYFFYDNGFVSEEIWMNGNGTLLLTNKYPRALYKTIISPDNLKQMDN